MISLLDFGLSLIYLMDFVNENRPAEEEVTSIKTGIKFSLVYPYKG